MTGDPAHQEQAQFRHVAGTSDIGEGKMIPVEVEGREIVLCRTREGWFAVDNVCTHAYARLHEGRLRGSRLICPLHGASFDCRNGAVLGPPAVAPLRSYLVRIVDGNVQIALRN
jgi:nitrite reductase/ring-hydroxylating ferredoxin subunit